MTDLLLILGSCVVIILFCIWYTVEVLFPIEKEIREGEQEKYNKKIELTDSQERELALRNYNQTIHQLS